VSSGLLTRRQSAAKYVLFLAEWTNMELGTPLKIDHGRNGIDKFLGAQPVLA